MSATPTVNVRSASSQDRAVLTLLRHQLWPEGPPEEHHREIGLILAGQWSATLPYVILVAETEEGAIAGFAEVGLRSHADGCDPRHPVGYLEGWYVAKEHRRRGVGRQLLQSAEEWVREHGCVEMASDTWIDNTASQLAHEALGFEVVDRCVNYRKSLQADD